MNTDSATGPSLGPVIWKLSPGWAEKQLRFRQSFQSALPMSGSPCGPRCVPVSYTHLDVYKRQGFYWLERAAESGNDYAAYQLGKEYLSGKNTPKNPECAAEYVRMAAEQGNPYAQYLLGKLCLSGDGAPQDKDAAYDWFQNCLLYTSRCV